MRDKVFEIIEKYGCLDRRGVQSAIHRETGHFLSINEIDSILYSLCRDFKIDKEFVNNYTEVLYCRKRRKMSRFYASY